MSNQLDQLRQQFLAYLAAHPFRKSPIGLYEPVDYIMQLGGKRMRPILALLAYQLFKKDVDAALPVAMAVEVFHNFSLVHDDIMDAADLRRGKPTVHAKYDTNTAILSGDVMLIKSYQYLAQIGDPHIQAKLIQVFNQVAIEVCEGQQYDVDFENRSDVRIDEYLKMIEYKTAALLAGSLSMGAIAAGADEAAVAHLDRFGRKVGIAFQIQDDLLDSFGDPAKFGKKVGGDICQNKKTILILQALKDGNANEQAQLNQLLSTPTTNEQQKITAVKSLLEHLHIPTKVKTLRDQYLAEALQELETLEVEAAQKAPLFAIANQLVDRVI
ncbi:MAG: polyprenyl synthetase family protein [Bacteroidota bacterium]